MALTKYKEKRNFKESPEPTGGSPDSEQLRFVIQKQLTEKFSIEKYKDTYTAKLLKRIKAKSKGKKITPPKMKVVHKQSDNLMDMLKASLEGSKKSKTA